jgi:hypothetical protein
MNGNMGLEITRLYRKIKTIFNNWPILYKEVLKELNDKKNRKDLIPLKRKFFFKLFNDEIWRNRTITYYHSRINENS